ncbi:hypothetical protein BMS3Abin03_01251 [bacterium BMS3Abin03]|nr:hypothetical protein BMS3Abin03_01251 [bacterium BMS3Abin03]
MSSNKYLPAIISGFGAAVLSTIPFLNIFNCCLIIPGAAILALYLYQKTILNGYPISLSNALGFGLLTGIIAAIFASAFDILITYIAHTNDLVQGLPQSEDFLRQFNLGKIMDDSIKLIEEMASDIEANGFSPLYIVMITISNLIIYSIFGTLGGLLGMAILNKRRRGQF